MNNVNSKETSLLYDRIKVITTILVVVAHAARMNTERGAFHPLVQSPLLAGLASFIYSFQMPLFIFVSGGVYQLCIDNGKYRDFIQFTINKTKRLVIPYLFWGLVLVTPVVVAFQLSDKSVMRQYIYGILLSLDCKHLWYCLALFGIYLITRCSERSCNDVIYCICVVILYVLSKWIPSLLQLNNMIWSPKVLVMTPITSNY